MRYWEPHGGKRTPKEISHEGRRRSIASSGSFRKYPFL